MDTMEKEMVSEHEKASGIDASELQEKGLRAASAFLQRRGYHVHDVQYQTDHGIIDLVVEDDEFLVFVEVKTKFNSDNAFPKEDLSEFTRSMREKAAVQYLAAHDFCDIAVRFDLVSILVTKLDRAFLCHHQNVFLESED